MSFRLLLLALVACGDAPAEEDPRAGGADEATAAASSAPVMGLDCPEGTTLEENVRDDGIERWCDRKGVQHGPYVRYHLDGSRAVQGAWNENQEDGTWVWWHDNGEEAARGRYIRGRQSGSWTWYWSNGNRSREGDYLQGREAGTWMAWYESGRKREEGLFHNGVKNGAWSYYLDNDENTLSVSETWANGVPVVKPAPP
jgi:antitoxin component YwqK of YwqJK toxin-antitoxin module